MAVELDFSIHVDAPASMSNLGPGFDAFGLCIDGIADTVIAQRSEETGVHVRALSGFTERIPADGTNTAAVGAQYVLDRCETTGGIKLFINKGIRIGSGIGGSAASAVAGVIAANELLGRPLSEVEVLQAALEAERSAAGAIHGDNVLPCMLGGFVLTTPGNPYLFKRYEVPDSLHLALLLPQFAVLTEEARAILPASVPLSDAAMTAAGAAHAVAALLSEDWPALGAAIMSDRLVERHRAKLIGFYSPVKAAAIESGAYGCALSGSGPAMFAIADSAESAQSIADAMLAALEVEGESGSSRVVRADNSGVRVKRLE